MCLQVVVSCPNGHAGTPTLVVPSLQGARNSDSIKDNSGPT